ncbi:MAG: 50S ribosomal protein L9 [Elusimicrobiota bacterium]|jgi:large subunit ribosomal protein L9|nr:50S ribosomal protein L9 [Elusimicrobiota bacterium]
MKVILLQDINNVGKMGDIKDVNKGYARNFLLKNKIALEANDNNLKIYKQKKEAEKKALQKEIQKAENISAKLTKLELKLLVKTGDSSKLFGSVTSSDIAEALKEKGFDIDKKNIILPEVIKSLGIYTVEIKLPHDIKAKVKVWISKE